MHVSLAQIVHRATTDDDEQFSPASLPWCVNGCCRRCGSSVVVEGGSRLAAVANTADWYHRTSICTWA